MNKTCIKIGTMLIAAGLLAETAAAPAYSDSFPIRRLSINGWVANFHPDAANRSLKNDCKHLNELSLFSVGATQDGRLAPETDFIDSALKITKGMPNRPQVLLTVANLRPHQMHDHFLLDLWLGSEERWRRHAQDLIKLAEPVDGLDLDYENLRPSDAANFEAFLVHLGNALHQRGKFLSVTIEHSTFMHGKIHWDRISNSVDRIRIMAYHYHYDRTVPGAISPPAIVARLAKEALAQIPADKLEIALPLYGFDWTRSGHAILVPTLEKYRELAHTPGAHVFRDSVSQSGRINYYATEKRGNRTYRILHRVWFEDPQSAAYKVRMLQQLGIVHIGFWQLGAGNVSELFDLVNKSS